MVNERQTILRDSTFIDTFSFRNRPGSRLRLSKGCLFPTDALWTLRAYPTMVVSLLGLIYGLQIRMALLTSVMG